MLTIKMLHNKVNYLCPGEEVVSVILLSVIAFCLPKLKTFYVIGHEDI